MAASKSNILGRLFLFLFLQFGANGLWAQNNNLATKITIILNNIPLEQALVQISQLGNFNFSYNSDLFRSDSLVSVSVRNKSVEKTLNQIFGNQVRYKSVGDHIVLLSNRDKKNNEYKMDKKLGIGGYTIAGYLFDASNGMALQNATVYEVDGRILANSDVTGYYSMILPSDRQMKGITYCRYGYHDSIILIRPTHSAQIDISLRPRQTEIQKIQSKTFVFEHDLESRQLVTWLVPEEAMTTAKNISIPERTTMQVSLLPFIGSDYKLSGTKTNNLSLNILAGYTGSVEGFELGGMVNIVQNHVKGAQMAGFGNIVGKDARGAQLAGFFNITNGSVTGAQIAGFQNTLNGEMHGVQLSGFNNVTTQNVDGVQVTGFVNVAFKDVKMAQLSGFVNYGGNIGGLQATGFVNIANGDVFAAQLAGFVNYGRNIGGLQASGFVNVAYGDVNAAQLAGFVNISKDVNGVQASGFLNVAYGNIGMAQLSGFANYCDSVTGAQIAGFVNVARLNVTAAQIAGFVNYGTSVTGAQLAGFSNICLFENKGVQISAFFNYAEKLNGVQVAVVNISDTVESGLPIGVFSFVRKGYHVVEVSADEVFYANASFKTGVKKFYNIFGFGRGEMNVANYTYGVGFIKPINAKQEFSFDFMYSSVNDRENSMEVIGSIIKFKPSYCYSFHKYFTAYAAPSLNTYLTQNGSEKSKSIAFHPFWDKTYSNVHFQMWAGLSVGIRL